MLHDWYSWAVIRSSYRIRTRLHRIRIVPKFYNHTLRLRYGCISMRFMLHWCSSNENGHKNNRQWQMVHCRFGRIRLLDTCESALRSRMRIEVRPTENDLTRLYKNGDISVVITCGYSSNLVGRTSKWYFIIKFCLLLSIVLCWREVRPDAGKTTENEFVASFL